MTSGGETLDAVLIPSVTVGRPSVAPEAGATGRAAVAPAHAAVNANEAAREDAGFLRRVLDGIFHRQEPSKPVSR